MDRQSVEDGFSVNVYEDQQLTIQSNNSFNLKIALPEGPFKSYQLLGLNGDCGFGLDQISTFCKGGYTDVQSLPQTSLVWDESDFNFTWNSDDTELTATFNYEKLLPTDKDSANVPDYMVTFWANQQANSIKDKSGILRRDNWFKLTEGDFEQYYKFAIKTDEVKPSVKTVIASSAEGGSLRGDTLKVIYSERMLIDTKSGDIGASNTQSFVLGQLGPQIFLNSDANLNPLNPNLYTVRVGARNFQPVALTDLEYTTYNWGDACGECDNINGSVVFDADDLTRKTVLLLPAYSSQNLFAPSDIIEVTVSSSIADPAGNTLDSKNDNKTVSAG